MRKPVCAIFVLGGNRNHFLKDEVQFLIPDYLIKDIIVILFDTYFIIIKMLHFLLNILTHLKCFLKFIKKLFQKLII